MVFQEYCAARQLLGSICGPTQVTPLPKFELEPEQPNIWILRRGLAFIAYRSHVLLGQVALVACVDSQT